MNKPRAILYTRVSSNAQVDGTSLSQQREIGVKHCDSKNYDLVEVFVEEGESAKYLDRTQLKEAIKFCQKKQNNIDYFLVYKFDRFSRDLSNHVTLRAILANAGVRLESMTEKTEDTPSGRLMENVLASFAQFDNDIRTERTVGGMKARLEEGHWIFTPPSGYTKDRTSSEKPLPIIFNPDNANFIKKAWSMMLSGNYSISDIAAYLKDSGVKTNQGAELTIKHLSRMFRNKFYTGIVYSDKFDIEVQGKHEAMISPLDFHKVQKLLNSDDKPITVSNIDPEFELAKTIYCDCCGTLLSPARSKGKNKYYFYYQCGNTKCNSRPNLPKDKAESEFRKLIASIKAPEEIDLFAEMLTRAYKEKYDDFEKIKQKAARDHQALENKISKLDKFLEEGAYSIEKYKQRKSELDLELMDVKIRLSESTIDAGEMETCINYVANFIKHLPKMWNQLDIEGKARFTNLIFPNGLIFEDGSYRTPELHPAIKEFRDFEASEINMVTPRRIELRLPD